ncbi:hypothetical protein B0H11DRAFT_2244198 [Mycena galericulata]|nr:hypothetical protein B0H11DRAFT_2244198 [Mycena galericulata]
MQLRVPTPLAFLSTLVGLTHADGFENLELAAFLVRCLWPPTLGLAPRLRRTRAQQLPFVLEDRNISVLQFRATTRASTPYALNLSLLTILAGKLAEEIQGCRLEPDNDGAPADAEQDCTRHAGAFSDILRRMGIGARPDVHNTSDITLSSSMEGSRSRTQSCGSTSPSECTISHLRSPTSRGALPGRVRSVASKPLVSTPAPADLASAPATHPRTLARE